MSNQKARIALIAAALLSFASASAQDATRPTDEDVIARWREANGFCRGWSGDENETWAWCNVRDALDAVLGTRGWCYGKPTQTGPEMDWQKCGPDTNPPTAPVMP